MGVDGAEIARVMRRLVGIVGLHLRRDAITAVGARHHELVSRAVHGVWPWVRHFTVVDQGAHV